MRKVTSAIMTSAMMTSLALADDHLVFGTEDDRFSWGDLEAFESLDLSGETISVFGPWLGVDETLVNSVFAYFEAATGATVRYAGSDSFEQQILIDVEAGSPPNVAIFPQPGLAADIAARGGLVPSAIVARELEIRLIDTACVASYHGQERGQVEILKEASLAGDGTGWLIVDDLVDTGETSRALRALLPQAHFATVYAKPAGRPLVDTFVTEVSQDTWIFFPWDMEPQPSTPIIGRRG